LREITTGTSFSGFAVWFLRGRNNSKPEKERLQEPYVDNPVFSLSQAGEPDLWIRCHVSCVCFLITHVTQPVAVHHHIRKLR